MGTCAGPHGDGFGCGAWAVDSSQCGKLTAGIAIITGADYHHHAAFDNGADAIGDDVTNLVCVVGAKGLIHSIERRGTDGEAGYIHAIGEGVVKSS